MWKVMNAVDGSAATYVRALAATRMAALRNAHAKRDRGASAIELAIITALIGLAALILAGVIVGVINKKIPGIRNL